MGTYAAQVEKKVGANFAGGRIQSRCDIIDQTWHCFFRQYQSPQAGRIDVYLAFPDTVSAARASTFAEDARIHTFNMAGDTFESLAQWPRSPMACTPGPLTARMSHFGTESAETRGRRAEPPSRPALMCRDPPAVPPRHVGR